MTTFKVGQIVQALPSSDTPYSITNYKRLCIAVVTRVYQRQSSSGIQDIIDIIPLYGISTSLLPYLPERYVPVKDQWQLEPMEILMQKIIMNQPVSEKDFSLAFKKTIRTFDVVSEYFKLVPDTSLNSLQKIIDEMWAHHAKKPFGYQSSSEEVRPLINRFFKRVSLLEGYPFIRVGSPHLSL